MSICPIPRGATKKPNLIALSFLSILTTIMRKDDHAYVKITVSTKTASSLPGRAEKEREDALSRLSHPASTSSQEEKIVVKLSHAPEPSLPVAVPFSAEPLAISANRIGKFLQHHRHNEPACPHSCSNSQEERCNYLFHSHAPFRLLVSPNR